MKKSLLFFFSLLLIPFQTNGQANDMEAAIYNIGIGAAFSTIGAVINKKPNEQIEKVILKGLWQGGSGGYVTFESKRLLRSAQEQENWNYYWPAKLVNAAGTSIKETAALNQNFWEIWHINIGFNRIEFHTKDKFIVRYKLMPVALVYTIGAVFRYDFDINIL
ncbi:MAG: hypothetical protein U1C46_03775 [Bacteroidales bacterium]|nr:hypothetical protein [Bacteroidales bacterium]